MISNKAKQKHNKKSNRKKKMSKGPVYMGVWVLLGRSGKRSWDGTDIQGGSEMMGIKIGGRTGDNDDSRVQVWMTMQCDGC
jgi:hypothetical protein